MIESKKSTLYKPKFLYSLRPMDSSLQHAVPPGLQSPQHGRVEVPGDPAVFFEVEKSMAEVICLRMMM